MQRLWRRASQNDRTTNAYLYAWHWDGVSEGYDFSLERKAGVRSCKVL